MVSEDLVNRVNKLIGRDMGGKLLVDVIEALADQLTAARARIRQLEKPIHNSSKKPPYADIDD